MANSLGRILTVDDVPTWSAMCSRILAEAGYQVDTTDSVYKAQEALIQQLYHLVLVDIRLNSNSSNEGGLHLLEWLDQQNYLKGMAVLILTEFGSVENVRRAFQEFGVVDFLTKAEFDKEKILSTIRNIFSGMLKRNLRLNVEYGSELSTDAITKHLQTLSEFTMYSLQRIEEEYVDLLMRLFPKIDTLILSPQSVVKLEPICMHADLYLESGVHFTRILQIGPWLTIERRYKETGEYVQQLEPLQICRTPILGGIIYSLPSLEAFGLYQQKISEISRNLKEMQQKNQRLDQFLTIAAHELQAPLKRIKAILEDLLEGNRPLQHMDIQKEFLADAHQEAQHELRLIDEMFDLTRLETEVDLKLQRHDLMNCVSSAVDRIYSELQGKNLQFRQTILQEGIEINCDPKWLNRAFYNVLHNAVKFTEIGEIFIGCHVDGDNAHIQIADTGIGIRSEDLSKIFDYRFRANSDFEGWGVGLYITKIIIERHKGMISATSIHHKGTTIHVSLPIIIKKQSQG